MITKRTTFLALGAIALFFGLGVIALTWEPAPSHGSSHFVEGWYLLDPWDATENGDVTFEFQRGEFRCSFAPGSGRDSTPALAGRYECRAEPNGDLIALIYDAPANANTYGAPKELHYRNAGGVSVLVWDADRFDRKHELGEFIMIDTPESFVGILRKHPDFATALPTATRTKYLVSWSRYQGCRFWDMVSLHPELRQHIPSWVIDRFYTEPYNRSPEQ